MSFVVVADDAVMTRDDVVGRAATVPGAVVLNKKKKKPVRTSFAELICSSFLSSFLQS